MGDKVPAECPECQSYAIDVSKRNPETGDTGWITYLSCSDCGSTLPLD